MLKPLDPLAQKWHDKLLETIEPHRKKPLLLSGGVDSATLLAALLELGERPECYTFRLGATDSTDVRVARRICKDWNLKIHVLKIERSLDVLVSDVRQVIKLLNTSKKASVQCAQPIMYMCERMHSDGFDSAIVGTGAVVLDDKRVAILASQQGEGAARAYRAEKLNDKNTDCGTGRMHQMARLMGIELAEPYSEEPLGSFALAIDYAELNRPRQKGMALRAFPEFYKRGYWRRNSSLQVNSGVREWHDTLLKTEYNTRNSKRVVAIYNDMRKEIKDAMA